MSADGIIHPSSNHLKISIKFLPLVSVAKPWLLSLIFAIWLSPQDMRKVILEPNLWSTKQVKFSWARSDSSLGRLELQFHFVICSKHFPFGEKNSSTNRRKPFSRLSI